MELGFGQPAGGVCQFAYVVEDVEAATERFTADLGVGPWFVRGPFQPPEGRYRGNPTTATFTLARGFFGHAMVELIEQHDDQPSVYHEGYGPRRYGFHHWAVMTTGYDVEVSSRLADGWEEAYYDRLPSGSRIAYLDSCGRLPGMIEFIEHTPAQEAFYTAMYDASAGWDGSDPLRREG